MLDQSFSPDNFRTIMQVLNRKGIYVEKEGNFSIDIFAESRAESGKLLQISQKIKDEKDRLWVVAKATKSKFDYKSFHAFKESFAEAKSTIRKNKEEILEKTLTELSKKTNQESYKVGVNKGRKKWDKQLYVDNGTAEDFFVLRQIQYNLKKSFKVKPSDRALILSQLATILNDEFPKVVIRADISSFYENINHKSLIGKISSNNILSSPSKRIIKQVLNKYWRLLVEDGIKDTADIRIGVPRGLGISAYLSEVYMREFDIAIQALPNVTYYARYVDDIVIIITPNSRAELTSAAQYIELIQNILHQKAHLKLNLDKTKVIDLKPQVNEIKAPKTLAMTFLGYKFSFRYVYVKTEISKSIKLLPLEVNMSNERRKRYANKIIRAFEVYEHFKSRFQKKSNRLLIRRVKYLTGNTKLIGNKSNVFVGIYFSNTELTHPQNDLVFLDKILSIKINKLTISEMYLKTRLLKFKFSTGYYQRVFHKYRLSTLNEILEIWD